MLTSTYWLGLTSGYLVHDITCYAAPYCTVQSNHLFPYSSLVGRVSLQSPRPKDHRAFFTRLHRNYMQDFARNSEVKRSPIFCGPPSRPETNLYKRLELIMKYRNIEMNVVSILKKLCLCGNIINLVQY